MMEKERVTTTSGEEALTESEVMKLLSVVDVLSHKTLLTLAIEYGIRRSDIVRIEKSNINFEEGWLIFHQKKKGDRLHSVPLTEPVIVLLKMYLKTIDQKTKWLFPSSWQTKKHLSDRQAWNILNIYLKRARLTGRGFHTLRATSSKLHLKNGWTRQEVARLLDDTLQTVDKHYTTPSKDEMKEAARDKPIFE